MHLLVSNYIVLADDDRDHGILFEHVLRQVDPKKKLAIVPDGEQLLSLLNQAQPEILFLDLKMPGKNGLECLQEIRRQHEYDTMKIVVYSASTHMPDIQKCYLHNADLYMVKPFQTEHLINALHTVLQKDSWEMASLKNHYYINNRLVPFTAQI